MSNIQSKLGPRRRLVTLGILFVNLCFIVSFIRVNHVATTAIFIVSMIVVSAVNNLIRTENLLYLHLSLSNLAAQSVPQINQLLNISYVH